MKVSNGTGRGSHFTYFGMEVNKERFLAFPITNNVFSISGIFPLRRNSTWLHSVDNYSFSV